MKLRSVSSSSSSSSSNNHALTTYVVHVVWEEITSGTSREHCHEVHSYFCLNSLKSPSFMLRMRQRRGRKSRPIKPFLLLKSSKNRTTPMISMLLLAGDMTQRLLTITKA